MLKFAKQIFGGKITKMNTNIKRTVAYKTFEI